MGVRNAGVAAGMGAGAGEVGGRRLDSGTESFGEARAGGGGITVCEDRGGVGARGTPELPARTRREIGGVAEWGAGAAAVAIEVDGSVAPVAVVEAAGELKAMREAGFAASASACPFATLVKTGDMERLLGAGTVAGVAVPLVDCIDEEVACAPCEEAATPGQSRTAWTGRVNQNAAPEWLSLRGQAPIWPRMARTSSRAMLRPRPVPLYLFCSSDLSCL
mmetsp:Transcript_15286/g.36059  ORF Transcript_15286/g.36059 Transcript_15286/m.36059 type:complete len:220 (-) Transcript_15286:2113-2772(-)